jgi:hypothetical protein
MQETTHNFVLALLMLLLLLAFTFAPALALEIRSGRTVTITSEEDIEEELYAAGRDIIIDGTVNDDIFAAGETVTINGAINGDVFACGRTVIINGAVQRSVIVAGEKVNINGDVKYDVRAAARIINIAGNISGDITVASSEFDIVRAAVIVGDILFGAKEVRIDGPIESEILGGGGNVFISNEVKGDVELRVEQLTLLPTANIHGNLTYTSKDEAEIHDEARVAGTITHQLPEEGEEKKRFFPFVLFFGIGANVIGFLMALMLGAIIILLIPKWLISTVTSIRNRPGFCAGWGAIVLFATPIAAIIACVTIIGIPLGLIALALYAIGLYLSQIPVSLFIGRYIISYFREVNTKAIMFGALALGLFIFRILRLIPFFGFLIVLAVLLFGLGAIVISVWKRRAEVLETPSA